MNAKSTFVIAAMAAALLSACGKQEAQAPMPESAPPDSTMAQASAGDAHGTHGTIQSMDQKARTVTIAHDPVPSLKWPAMTMTFQVQNDEALAGLEEGAQVEFSFTAQPGNQYVITAISPRH